MTGCVLTSIEAQNNTKRSREQGPKERKRSQRIELPKLNRKINSKRSGRYQEHERPGAKKAEASNTQLTTIQENKQRINQMLFDNYPRSQPLARSGTSCLQLGDWN
mmetsp:Transcript_15823/g.26697  ORF Transcript_15823/g.26697 Transcript_15823/m.26697 type:complete len:106 (+) Transcript_15823:150-467(+)